MNEINTSEVPQEQSASDRAVSLQKIIDELAHLSANDRHRLIETVITFFDIELTRQGSNSYLPSTSPSHIPDPSGFRFSEDAEALSPKEFILSKSPKTDVERVACLAYYLAHYRDTPHVKTKDISSLNTESAHRAFANAANAVSNATKSGHLVPSIKGSKQLSAAGEQFVVALPDREAAKTALSRTRTRRGKTNKKRAVKTKH